MSGFSELSQADRHDSGILARARRAFRGLAGEQSRRLLKRARPLLAAATAALLALPAGAQEPRDGLTIFLIQPGALPGEELEAILRNPLLTRKSALALSTGWRGVGDSREDVELKAYPWALQIYRWEEGAWRWSDRARLKAGLNDPDPAAAQPAHEQILRRVARGLRHGLLTYGPEAAERRARREGILPVDLVFILKDAVQTGLSRPARPAAPQCLPHEAASRLLQEAAQAAAAKGFALDARVYLAATGAGARSWAKQDALHLLRGAGLLGGSGAPDWVREALRFDPSCAAGASAAEAPFGALHALDLAAAAGACPPLAELAAAPLPEAGFCAAPLASKPAPPPVSVEAPPPPEPQPEPAPPPPVLVETPPTPGVSVRVAEAVGATRMGLEALTLSASSGVFVALRREGEARAFPLPIRPQAQLPPGGHRLVLTASPPEACRDSWSFSAEIQIQGRLSPGGAARLFSVAEAGLPCAAKEYELLRF